jgi:ubiquinone/menaquinone biosynthesis C-methylase UbiE
MRDQAKKRLRKYGLDDHVELHLGDAVTLPWEGNKFDAVFMSFTLELFDTSEIPLVLSEARRVVKQGGRLGVVSLSKDYGQTIPMGIYEWLHQKFPGYLDCRPINVEKSIKDAGFEISHSEQHRLFGLPVAICVGKKTAAGN